MRLLIVGAPGAGKGTQATRIAEHYSIPAISTGAIFRAEVASGSELGTTLKSIMDSGSLVPDEITDKVVASQLSSEQLAAGWLLDGYPRNLSQVDTLEQLLSGQGTPLDAVVSLDVDEDDLVARLLGRAAAEGRSDDNEETIRNRMAVYRSQTEPLIAVYRDRGLLIELSGEGSVDQVTERIFAALDPVAAGGQAEA